MSKLKEDTKKKRAYLKHFKAYGPKKALKYGDWKYMKEEMDQENLADIDVIRSHQRATGYNKRRKRKK